MKLSELKHNHSLTDLLKILLFAILMLAPIGMVATRCLYVIANKNAYQSYYGETINETTFTNNLNTLDVNNDYELNITEMPNSQQTSQYIYVDRIYDLEGIPTSSTYYTEIPNATAFSLYHNSNLNSYSLRYTYNNETKYYGFATVPSNALSPFTFKFEISADYQNTNTDLQKYIYKMTYNKDSYLDNVFEYSVSQLEESNLFNWTENTAIFSGIQTMTTQLGITSQTIPILLTYWFLLTVIYVIIDIILKLFTYMTHALGNRKA